jgi:ribose 5-phosphate isomerase B
MLKIGFANDHGGYSLRSSLLKALEDWGYEVQDFGAARLDPDDDFPDFVIPLAQALARGEVQRGVAVCGSGVGASVAANKVAGVRAALITDVFSAHQGVEDDNMNLLCLGARVIGPALARDLLEAFLKAEYTDKERFRRRLAKIAAIEQ